MRTGRAVRLLGWAMVALPAYYAVQYARDRRPIVRDALAAPGEVTSRRTIDVSHVVLRRVPLGTEEREAARTLERGGFSVEPFEAARYEWLRYNCADCDRGMWARYEQSYLRGGARILVGVGLLGGRVAHLEAHRSFRIIEVP